MKDAQPDLTVTTPDGDTIAVEVKVRERSSIAFPYNDLEDAVEVVSKMYQRTGMASCTLDQLAAWTGSTSPASGYFKNKVAATRYFGLITLDKGQVSLTAIAREILDPQRRKAGLVKAFLNVPLYKRLFESYRGRPLPPDVGLENDIRSLGVVSTQADKARQTFKRSAEQAGFLAMGKDRLVLPPSGEPVATKNGVETGGAGSSASRQVQRRGGGEPPAGLHPKIRLLLSVLPPSGEPWAVEDQEEWLDLLRGALTQIYPAATLAEATGE